MRMALAVFVAFYSLLALGDYHEAASVTPMQVIMGLSIIPMCILAVGLMFSGLMGLSSKKARTQNIVIALFAATLIVVVGYRELRRFNRPRSEAIPYNPQAGFQAIPREEPDSGKVSNNDPAHQFAFEVQGSFTIGQVLTHPEGESDQKLRALDDYGNAVLEVPLELTSRHFSFYFFDQTIALPYDKPSIRIPLLVECIAGIVALKIIPRLKETGTDLEAADDLLKLPFYRFYYSKEEGTWIVTFDTWSQNTK